MTPESGGPVWFLPENTAAQKGTSTVNERRNDNGTSCFRALGSKARRLTATVAITALLAQAPPPGEQIAAENLLISTEK